jgi:uncharacterized protein DUF5715
MCQTATLAIALVALTAVGAHAAPAPAKLHRHTTPTSGAQAARHASSRRHQAAPAHTRTQTQLTTTRKPTPHEAGRTAGLAIRRDLAQKHPARRNVALHVETSRATSRQESERPLRSKKETRVAPAMEVASASPVFLLRPAQAEEPALAEELQQPEASARNQPRAATTNRITPPAPNAETPDSETPDAPTEQASLRVPLRANPPPLRGSLESLQRQNARLDAEGLERIEDESDLADRIARKLLVPIPASIALTVNAELPATHRYCRPWTALFLTDLARAHDAAFHRPLEVSSAVRTMEYQKRLMEINGNAAPAEGDIVSPHLTGATIDIAKDGLSRDEIAWMRRRLLALEAAGKIDVEEEFRQSCFHITVYKNYTPPSTPHPATQAGSGSAGTKRHKAADPSRAVAAQGL